jgi:tRNA nucleotidyltransferase/poly(A) polymerase
MAPLQRPAPADWMTEDAVTGLLRTIAPARFVGGAVRDWLLGRPVTDIDIATALPPATVVERLKASGIRVIPTGLDHGTVTALVGNRAYEITTLRRDVETDGRHARVAFTGDWADDAARRDFTMNALYAEPDGTLYDPTGGLDDLAMGLVRFIGDPEQRIAEDRLRLLRYFRFLAWYGTAKPNPGDLEACRSLSGTLGNLSVERVWMELKKLFSAPDPSEAVALMIRLGVMPQVLPEATASAEALKALIRLEQDKSAAPNALRRLALLIDHARIEPLATRLRLSSDEASELAAMADVADHHAEALAAPWPMLRRHGAKHMIDGALIAAAKGANEALALLPIARSWTDPAFPISGGDALALGLKPGPAVGVLLRSVEDWWVRRGCIDDRAACLGRLLLENERLNNSS